MRVRCVALCGVIVKQLHSCQRTLINRRLSTSMKTTVKVSSNFAGIKNTRGSKSGLFTKIEKQRRRIIAIKRREIGREERQEKDNKREILRNMPKNTPCENLLTDSRRTATKTILLQFLMNLSLQRLGETETKRLQI